MSLLHLLCNQKLHRRLVQPIGLVDRLSVFKKSPSGDFFWLLLLSNKISDLFNQACTSLWERFVLTVTYLLTYLLTYFSFWRIFVWDSSALRFTAQTKTLILPDSAWLCTTFCKLLFTYPDDVISQGSDCVCECVWHQWFTMINKLVASACKTRSKPGHWVLLACSRCRVIAPWVSLTSVVY